MQVTEQEQVVDPAEHLDAGGERVGRLAHAGVPRGLALGAARALEGQADGRGLLSHHRLVGGDGIGGREREIVPDGAPRPDDVANAPRQPDVGTGLGGDDDGRPRGARRAREPPGPRGDAEGEGEGSGATSRHHGPRYQTRPVPGSLSRGAWARRLVATLFTFGD